MMRHAGRMRCFLDEDEDEEGVRDLLRTSSKLDFVASPPHF
jgi:hypothetical protein